MTDALFEPPPRIGQTLNENGDVVFNQAELRELFTWLERLGNLETIPENDAYGSEWDGSEKAASKGSLYDKIEALVAGGLGDMVKSVYDPGNTSDDVFDMDNMSEGATNKILTDGERTKLTGIETGADITDEQNVTDALDGAILIPIVTPASTDKVLVQDASDGDNLKHVLFSEFGGLFPIYDYTTHVYQTDASYIYNAWERFDATGYLAMRTDLSDGSAAGEATGALPMPGDLTILTYV